MATNLPETSVQVSPSLTNAENPSGVSSTRYSLPSQTTNLDLSNEARIQQHISTIQIDKYFKEAKNPTEKVYTKDELNSKLHEILDYAVKENKITATEGNAIAEAQRYRSENGRIVKSKPQEEIINRNN